MRATCLSHLILLNVVIVTILIQAYKLLRSSLHNFCVPFPLRLMKKKFWETFMSTFLHVSIYTVKPVRTKELFPTNILNSFLISPMCASRPAHLVLPDLITLIIILGEAYKLRSSSLCSLLQPPTTSFLS
jgi:hypothetical protein